jgi:hypothetical protein
MLNDLKNALENVDWDKVEDGFRKTADVIDALS